MTIRLELISLCRRYAWGRRVSTGLLICIAGAISGCATSSGKHYTHQTMPTQMLAAKRDNVQTLELQNLARASNNSDMIDRGDVLEVSISAGLNEKDTVVLPVRVNEQGIAQIPEIGPIALAGLEPEAAEATIVAACIEQQLYQRPTVTVTMKRQRMNRVMVTGAVKKPDMYELPRGRSDLLAAIVAAGGLEDDAGTNVEIRNPRRAKGGRSAPVASGAKPGIDTVGHSSLLPTEGSTVSAGDGMETDVLPISGGDGMESIKIDLVSATKTRGGGYVIEDGGVVRVEKRDPEPLHVIGLVRKPDRYDFPIAEDLRVTDAIALAGGTSMSLADKIFVVRRIPQSSETAVIQISLRQAKRNSQANLRLEPGDVVSVENTPATALYEAINVVRFNVGASLPLAGGGVF